MFRVLAVALMLSALLLPPTLALWSGSAYDGDTWRDAGHRKVLWLVSFAIVPFGIASMASLIYFLRIRPRLRSQRT